MQRVLYLLAVWLIENDVTHRGAASRLPAPVIFGHVLFALGGLAVPASALAAAPSLPQHTDLGFPTNQLEQLLGLFAGQTPKAAPVQRHEPKLAPVPRARWGWLPLLAGAVHDTLAEAFPAATAVRAHRSQRRTSAAAFVGKWLDPHSHWIPGPR